MTVTTPAPVPAGTADVDKSSAGIRVHPAGAWWLLVAGVVGLVSSAALLVEKIGTLQNPDYVPSCSINPVLACGSVINTPQASLFGPPNPLFGVVAFTVVIVTGVLAIAKVALPRWYWAGLAIGTGLGVVFVNWLAYQSLYEIGALCPYCMVVWAVTVPLFAGTAPIALRPLAANPVAGMLYTWRWPLVTLWFTAIMLLILVRFWDYWSTLL